ncbi:MAG: 5-carboxymethyl-2-hydroxymuconate isomerase [Planctomycetaceae bacterium]|nr:5-carboxymethyl-2-hydroxymuconate isomerase [Planctomycetaceae bacterium]
MRLCRYEQNGRTGIAFYNDDSIIPLAAAADATGASAPESTCLISYLTNGSNRGAAVELQQQLSDEQKASLAIPVADVKLLVPNPNPTKLMLLAGNYSKHIEEGGGKAAERAQTFPYVFMKPPLTTLTNPGDPVVIPSISPDHIDWELELGVIIGKQAKGVSEADALDYVAGYTVVNDISDRKFKPNPDRTEREKDGFFDWLHGKWHDTFCPMGPCVLPADETDDPQQLKLTLKVNGEVEQDGCTSEMVFPVAAIVEFISSYVTLEPGDIISTGTTSGVGSAKGKFLKPGDLLEAEIGEIGLLSNPVKAE